MVIVSLRVNDLLIDDSLGPEQDDIQNNTQKIRKHRYDVGQVIMVLLHDWTPRRVLCSKTVEATILAKLIKPFGYDIKLAKTIIFKGNIPFPLTINDINNNLLSAVIVSFFY